jgi:hypothetical protein
MQEVASSSLAGSSLTSKIAERRFALIEYEVTDHDRVFLVAGSNSREMSWPNPFIAQQ